MSQCAGAASRSLTSSAVTLNTKNQRKLVRVERNPKKKAYMQLHTSHGHLNLELHCDIAPRTCENFLALAESGYYKDTIFHRSIKNFMLQVGRFPSTFPSYNGKDKCWTRWHALFHCLLTICHFTESSLMRQWEQNPPDYTCCVTS